MAKIPFNNTDNLNLFNSKNINTDTANIEFVSAGNLADLYNNYLNFVAISPDTTIIDIKFAYNSDNKIYVMVLFYIN